MRVIWSEDAAIDLGRLHAFLAVHSPAAAERAVAALIAAPDKLLQFPRMGQRIESVPDHEVRRLLVGRYELRYEARRDMIVVLRAFHTREDR